MTEIKPWDVAMVEDVAANGANYSSSAWHMKNEIEQLRAFKKASDEEEPAAWVSDNVIPLRGLKDNHPAILTATKCAANPTPLYLRPAPAVDPVPGIGVDVAAAILKHFDDAVSSATVLGAAQAQHGCGTYTQTDAITERAMHRALAAHRRAIRVLLGVGNE